MFPCCDCCDHDGSPFACDCGETHDGEHCEACHNGCNDD